MPDPAGTFNDGGIRLIEQTISLKDSTGASVDYILKKCSLKGGSSRIVSQNENGVETKQRFAAQIPTGSGTLQFIQLTDKPPVYPQAFTATTSQGTAQNFILHGVGEEMGTNEEVMVPIEIAVQKNPPAS